MENTIGIKVMSVFQDLSEAWLNAVGAGKIVNEFETSGKERLESGLAFKGGRIEYYARNLTTGAPVVVIVEERPVAGTAFRIQYNGVRALRAGGRPRPAGKQPDLPGEAGQCRFHCQELSQRSSILRREPVAQVALKHSRWNAYPNATPFEREGHLLWIPIVLDGPSTVLPHLLQRLSFPLLEDILILFRRSRSMLLFFNALHGGASVNHIHVQGLFHRERLAIEAAETLPSSGSSPCRLLHNYPARGLVFDRDVTADLLFPALDQLQRKEIAFNLILIGERICLIPRNPDHEVVPEFPGGGIASMELSGKLITVDKKTFERIDRDAIWHMLKKTTLPVEEALPEYA